MPYPDDVPRLTDGRVTLRPLHVDDAPRVVEQCNDPESITWTTVPRPYGTAEAHDWITRVAPACWADGTDLVLAVERDGVFAGSVALRPRGGGEAEVGFGLHPDARGKGVMRAALSLLLDWAFAEQGTAVVHWRAQVGNWDSRRVAWAVGFTFGPTIPRLLDQRGERVDAWTGWIGRHDPRVPVAPWHEVPVLEAGDLRLRPWAEHDGDRLVETSRDPVLRAFLPDSPLPAEPDAVAAYLTRVHLSAANGARLGWCVADSDTDRALAGVALFDLEGPDGAGAAQVGYWSHPEGRGRGVVTRGLERLAAYAFSPAPEGLGMRRLYLLTAASNAASRRVAERAGFEHVGTERRGATVADGFDDNLLYDRLAPRA